MSDVRRDVQCRISTLTTVANFWGVLLLLVFKNEYLATANHAHGSAMTRVASRLFQSPISP
jgi:hypothetical protein